MSHLYQVQDFDVCDYELYALPGITQLLRGPRPNNISASGRFVAFLGAAQTFGTLCRYPFPNLLSSMLGLEALNLSFGGAGPRMFLRMPRCMELANRARCCVVQVLSGRSAENSVMVNPFGTSVFRWRADSEGVEPRHAVVLYRELINRKSKAELAMLVQETRDSWVTDFAELANRITVPKVLLWLSVREPDYQISYSSVNRLFGAFPQLVDGATLSRVSGYFDRVVMCVSAGGLPAPLLNRFTGKRVQVQRDLHLMKNNGYYPSQEMHMRAALALEPVIRSYV